MTWQGSVYQIDFSVADAGKRVASTKRRIRWRFGFPNPSALEQGATGTECRGEEHDIVVVWSITSGKRQISMDTREVHYSHNRAGLLDHTWTTKGNHVIKVICNASPPLSSSPGFRQYDLLVDGQSFFTMPKVYELGLKGPSNSYSGRGNGRSAPPRGDLARAAPTTRTQEEEDLKRAIQASLDESRAHLGEHAPHQSASVAGADLLGFSEPAMAPAPPPMDSKSVASFYSAPPINYNSNPAPYQSPPPLRTANPVGSPAIPPNPGALVPAVAPQGYYGAPPPPSTPQYAAPPSFASPPATAPPQYAAPPPQQQQYGAPPPQQQQYAAPPPQQQYGAPPSNNLMNAQVQSNDIFGLNSAPGDDPFAPKAPGPPTHNDLANMVLNAYAPQPQTPGAAPMQNGHYGPNGGVPNGTSHPGTTLTMNPMAPEEEAPANDVDAVLKKLVNIDRIDEQPDYGRKLTMIKDEEKKKKTKNGKSVPLPPVGSGMIGQNASLQQISTVKDTNKPVPQGVMSAPPPGVFSPGAAHGGALVVHGQGPPPLQQARGFGLGAQLPNGGFGQQQQQQQAPNAYQQPAQQQRYY
ncbi:unnamed protein product [Cylindrotheca closterium]|uniref:Uncharacterized protein n=1 Tax=Cylindrotheca closterium TaxID=2856 RepID=A0AAD2G9A3_9STRA|nr:unnamed protein product [Cylindrotheca closterium]